METTLVNWCRYRFLGLLLLLAAPAHAAELTIGAAISLRESLEAAKVATEKKLWQFSFAGSQILARQSRAGAPLEVVLSADEQTLEQLAAHDAVVKQTMTPFLSNKLVAITAKGQKDKLHHAKDLLQPSVRRIAIGQAEVPAGRYARAYLDRKDLQKPLLKKFVEVENVRGVLTLVSKGRVDCGFVYSSDLIHARPRPTVAWEIRSDELPPIRYTAAVTKHCRDRKACSEVIAWLKSPPVQDIFIKEGFSPLP